MIISALVRHMPVSGVWTSPDGRISLELRPDGRFVETRDKPFNLFTGVYVLMGETLKLFEDSGAVATGTLADGRLSIGPIEQRAFHPAH
jgi:Agrobacterium tumefaciens protein Atu4866